MKKMIYGLFGCLMFSFLLTSFAQDDLDPIEAVVPCKDTEHAGSGSLRARICVQGGSADCTWQNYKLPSVDGTCHFGPS